MAATSDSLSEALPHMAMATKAIHADDSVSAHRAIAPAMHVAVTYRYAHEPANLIQMENKDPNAPLDSHVYGRYSAPNASRFESVLEHLFGGGGIMTYSTGLAAFHAAMVLLNPRRVCIGPGYHGVHSVIELVGKLSGAQKLGLEERDLDQLCPGDVLHVETPVNPTGEARDLTYYRARAHAAGAYLTVDATLAPPPLQSPLDFGADLVLHSGTKYIGGHSDLMCGILVVHLDRVREGWIETLFAERMILGAVMGNLEGWLGLRSLRTLELRVRRQSETAERLVAWLAKQMQEGASSVVGRVVESVRHASLQTKDLQDGWLRRQMPGGFAPVFSIWLRSAEQAKRLPGKMLVFQHATSLGDVESLIEWRAMSDKSCDERLLRVSCGLEDVEDLKQDFLQAFRAVCQDTVSS